MFLDVGPAIGQVTMEYLINTLRSNVVGNEIQKLTLRLSMDGHWQMRREYGLISALVGLAGYSYERR